MEEVKNTTVEETVETTVNNTEETTANQPGMFKAAAQVAGNFLGKTVEMIKENPGKAVAIGGAAIFAERVITWAWNYCKRKNRKTND